MVGADGGEVKAEEDPAPFKMVFVIPAKNPLSQWRCSDVNGEDSGNTGTCIYDSTVAKGLFRKRDGSVDPSREEKSVKLSNGSRFSK